MKAIHYYLTFCLLLILVSVGQSQTFSRLEIGVIVNSASDSRSVNIADVNGDGWEDVFISNGLSGGQKDRLYLNDQNGNFTPLTASSVVDDQQPSVGASLADFDNDGDIDIYVTNWYGKVNRFYENDGSGHFTASSNATVNSSTYSETATWGDYDADGLLDIFVTNSEGGSKANVLYRNVDGGEFSKQNGTPWSGRQNISRNANWIDYDNDGDMDIYITNEGNQVNELYTNDGSGKFSFVTEDIVINRAYATMTSSWGDIDNDGDLDLFLGNAGYFSERANALFRNQGNGQFVAITEGDAPNANGCNYSSSFGDVDNDGDLDLLVTSAFCDSDKLKDILYLNDGTGIFQTAANPLPGDQNVASYGAAMGDVNKDGFLDLIIAHCKNSTNSPQPKNAVYYNDKNDNHWLRVALEGVISNRSAVGARVYVYYQKNGTTEVQMRVLNTQSGYSGQNSPILHFGLGQSTEVDSVRVDWPSGLHSHLPTQAADQLISLVEEFDSAIKGPAVSLAHAISIFPNPISSKDTQITIAFSSDYPLTTQSVFSLRDQLGRELFRQTLAPHTEQQQIRIPTQLLAGAGYYAVFYQGNKVVATKKMIVDP